MSSTKANIVTAGLRPELFADPFARHLSRKAVISLLVLLALAGFGLRAWGLSAEGLSEDELNKLNAVADYRAHGLTAINSEHPLLMKAFQTGSVVAAEKWNGLGFVAARPAALGVRVEAALRLPSIIFGALTAILIYLVAAELFGVEVGLIAAALWAVEPQAAGFNRIAKEDTFLLFFFLLANVFWLRGQRVAEGDTGKDPRPYYWATGAAYGAMLASKYVPHYIAISACYNYVFQGIKATRWRIGRPRYAIFLAVMGAVFLLCNPTILLPGTWRQMLAFAGQKRIGHDGNEFMGALYPHHFTAWLKGVPWYFYFVFIGVKLPPATVLAFVVGLPQLFRRRLGDGRYFLLFWAIYWLPWVVLGGKFTRYFTFALPLVLIAAAVGMQSVARLLVRGDSESPALAQRRLYLHTGLASLLLGASLWASLDAAPHYRLYTNLFGGGAARAGHYFPHDEFYDSRQRESLAEIARRARAGAKVASETPGLADYYARQAGRDDLVSVSLSDPSALKELAVGDFVIVARGRRYFSNDARVTALRQTNAPAFSLALGETPAVDVYVWRQSDAVEVR
ncbi:MAG: glycosyltransferase family 39 protein [Pyrinomonadaceae bacterium]